MAEKSIPRELIKFYSINEHSVDALLNKYLWAAHPLTFNDPFDCPIQLWNLDSFTEKEMRRMIKSPFSNYISNDVIKNRTTFLGHFYRFTGIICLNEYSLVNQDVLWGYYTNQEGFAIKLDNTQLMSIWGEPFKVKYHNEEELKHFDIHMIENPQESLVPWATQKKEVWSVENEWRFIFFDLKRNTKSMETSKSERKKKYPSSAIQEIILGLEFFNSKNIVEVSERYSIYIIDTSKHKLQNDILSFLSLPSKIPVKQMYMKQVELKMSLRACTIFKEQEGRFRIDYLE